MRFPPSFLDDLRARLPASDIIGRRVRLKKGARGEYSGLCPFHNEKTPSFTVSDTKGFYHCFGCGAHGDVIKFVVETQNLGFAEAVKMLAEQAGLPLPKPDEKAEERERRAASLHDVMEAACAWFGRQLESSGAPMEYLRRRGLDREIISRFRLGYAPDSRSGLKDALGAKGISERQMIEAGLLIEPEGAWRASYDRFRGRIMFPICDARGRVIAFGGRIMGEGQPKYLNSPETELFRKSQVLYGLHLAADRAREKENIALVEGYMDVIALHRAGIANVVAPLGTALTAEQIGLLWRYAKEPVLCMDGDAAGARAMARAAEACLPLLQPGYSLRFAPLPQGQDPDDLVRGQGAAFLRGLLAGAEPLAGFLWTVHTQGRIFATPEQQAGLEKQLAALADTIQNAQVRNHYRRYFRDRLWQAFRNRGAAPEAKAKKLSPFPEGRERYEKLILWTAASHPELLHQPQIEEDLMRIEFHLAQADDVRRAILRQASSNAALDGLKEDSVLEREPFRSYMPQWEKETQARQATRGNETAAAWTAWWDYIVASYEFCCLEEEHHQAVPAPGERFFELKQQKDRMKKLVESRKMSYEAALDLADK